MKALHHLVNPEMMEIIMALKSAALRPTLLKIKSWPLSRGCWRLCPFSGTDEFTHNYIHLKGQLMQVSTCTKNVCGLFFPRRWHAQFPCSFSPNGMDTTANTGVCGLCIHATGSEAKQSSVWVWPITTPQHNDTTEWPNFFILNCMQRE